MRRLAARRPDGPDKLPGGRRRTVALLTGGLAAALLMVATVVWWPRDRPAAPASSVSASRASRPLADPAVLQHEMDRVVEAGAPGVVGLVRAGGRTWQGASGLGDLRANRPAWSPGGKRITVRQLRNHTSGLSNYTDDLPEPPRRFRPRKLVAIAIATGHRPAAGRPAGAAHSRASGARRHRAGDHPAGTCWPTGRCPYSSSSPWPRAVIPERDARHCRTAALVAASSVRSRRW